MIFVLQREIKFPRYGRSSRSGVYPSVLGMVHLVPFWEFLIDKLAIWKSK